MPHITLRAIANNAEIDVIWEAGQEELEPLRVKLNRVLGASWEEWEIPRDADETWPDEVRSLHAQWWDRRIARQKEIDASIAANADYEYLYDKPYEDRHGKVRVAGPFTVESISPTPRPWSGRERRHRRGVVQRLRERVRLRPSHAGQPENLRRPAGP